MGYMDEYIEKIKHTPLADLENELQELIGQFNELYSCELILFLTDMEKNVTSATLSNSDYEVLYDMLLNKSDQRVVMNIETPGGSGEAAHDIARLLHDKYEEVYFLVAGEAKSAGTILVLSGDEILMTGSGSLGPIDAQMQIGRTRVSAHDYLNWINEKKKEAADQGKLNPFDAVMTAQITPGELKGVNNAYHYAVDLVKEWLPKHKFKNWDYTKSRGQEVTDQYKKQRAEEIAFELTNQSRWRSHGRSLKIQDLEEIGLQIIDLDKYNQLSDITYKIKALCKMMFAATARFKMYATADKIINRQAVEKSPQDNSQNKDPDVARFEVKCPSCQKKYTFYIKFEDSPEIDKNEQSMGYLPYPSNGNFTCECGDTLDLTPYRTRAEETTGKKAII